MESLGTLGNHKATISSNDHFRALRAHHVNTPRSSMLSVRYLCVSRHRAAHPCTYSKRERAEQKASNKETPMESKA